MWFHTDSKQEHPSIHKVPFSVLRVWWRKLTGGITCSNRACPPVLHSSNHYLGVLKRNRVVFFGENGAISCFPHLYGCEVVPTQPRPLSLLFPLQCSASLLHLPLIGRTTRLSLMSSKIPRLFLRMYLTPQVSEFGRNSEYVSIVLSVSWFSWNLALKLGKPWK